MTEEAALKVMLDSGVTEKWATIANYYQSYVQKGNNGEADASPAEFERILGRPLTPLADALKEIIAAQDIASRK